MSYNMDNIGRIIIDSIRIRYPNHKHPRLIMTPDRIEHIRSHIGTGDVIDLEVKNLLEKADQKVGQPHNEKTVRDGLRMSTYVYDYAFYPALAYLITGDKKYAQTVIGELMAICGYPDWNHYQHFLDVGNMCTGAALCYDWVYDCMSPEQRALVRKTIMEYALVHGMGHYIDEDDYLKTVVKRQCYHWYQDYPGDNWKLICDGGMGLCCMAICDETDDRIVEEVLTYGYKDIYTFIRNCYDNKDGSYVEGLSYWSYGGHFLGYYASAMKTAIGTNLDLLDTEGVKKTGFFPTMLSSNNHVTFSFGDGFECINCEPYALYIGHVTNQPGVSATRYNYIKEGHYAAQDLLWMYPEDVYDGATLPLDYGCVEATNATFRTGWGDSDLFAAIHFGKNRVPHGHLDMGQFAIDYKNRRFFCDIGKEDYNLHGCYSSYRVIAEGHNTLCVNPTPSTAGMSWDGEAYINKFVSTDDFACATCDMTSSYGLKSVNRGLMLDRKNVYALVQDEIEATASDMILWSGHTKADIDLAPDGKSAVLTMDGVQMKVVSLADGEFKIMEAKSTDWSPKVDGQSSNEGTKKLAMILTGKEKYTVSVAFIPENKDVKPEVKALKEW